MHTPPWQASPLVQVLPSSQGVASATAVPMHSPLWQVSPVVQAFPSSHGVLSGSGVPAQTPPSQVSLLVQEFLSSHAPPSSSAALPTQVPFWQVSAAVQALPSSQLVPVSGVTVQLAVPLQVRVLHSAQGVLSCPGVPVRAVPVQVAVLVQVCLLSWSEVQGSAVLTQCVPLVQVSSAEQALPSSQLVPVSGVTVQLAVPLQVRVLHWSEVQVMAVPTHCPPLVQVSLNEQALPSSHAAPVLGVTVQLAVPLQVRVLHWSEVHVIAVPTQCPTLVLVSSNEQAWPSS